MCPIYEYSCSKGCPGWEELQKVNDPVTKKCPICDKNTAKRLISGGGSFILKGNGFYKQSMEHTIYAK